MGMISNKHSYFISSSPASLPVLTPPHCVIESVIGMAHAGARDQSLHCPSKVKEGHLSYYKYKVFLLSAEAVAEAGKGARSRTKIAGRLRISP